LSPVTIRKQEKFVVLVAEDLGLQAWHAGPIDNSVVAESLTSVLIIHE
jgi:predicted dinucleotide-binding enzyme